MGRTRMNYPGGCEDPYEEVVAENMAPIEIEREDKEVSKYE